MNLSDPCAKNRGISNITISSPLCSTSCYTCCNESFWPTCKEQRDIQHHNMQFYCAQLLVILGSDILLYRTPGSAGVFHYDEKMTRVTMEAALAWQAHKQKTVNYAEMRICLMPNRPDMAALSPLQTGFKEPSIFKFRLQSSRLTSLLSGLDLLQLKSDFTLNYPLLLGC